MFNKVKQKPTQINLSTYQEVFELITILTRKYVVPNLPKKYAFIADEIEVGKIYKKGDKHAETVYFVVEGIIGYSFMSYYGSIGMGISTYNLEEIIDHLYTPQQILCDFYLKLIKFSKDRKKKIKGLKLALHLMKVIVEDEEEFRT